eukprot:2293878-Amphidinium_carterae.1
MQNLLEKYAEVSRAPSKEKPVEPSHLCECTKAILMGKAQGLMEDFPKSPVLLQYSMDLTPMKIRKHLEGRTPGDKRSMLSKQDLLMQLLQVTVCDGSDTYQNAIVLRDPCPVDHGKSSLALAPLVQGFLGT